VLIQAGDDRKVLYFGRLHQLRLAAALRFEVGVLRDEILHNVELAGSGGRYERGFAAVFPLDVCAVLDEVLYQRELAFCGGLNDVWRGLIRIRGRGS
jgi:hypothetical protein